MAFRRGLFFLPSVFLLTGCSGPPNAAQKAADPGSSDAAAANADAGTSADGGPIAASACASPVVWLRTGSDSACGGGNTHAWPVGLKASDCHGWQAVGGGRTHDNSANDIRCNADGSFSFVQFAGNLNCSGTGTLKNYTLNVCEQDIPPSLYTVAFDTTCCARPTDAACKTAVPSVGVPGGIVFLNGGRCTP